MAAATNDWDDIDEKFLQCPICLDQLREPKQLTCLHRFCSECLGKFLQGSLGIIKCPECREEIAVPDDGVKGFKTDFHLKNIIEFIRLKKSLVENKEAEECYSCSKRKEVSAYCLKCSCFLCKECHQFHRTSKITKDHLPSILDLKDPAIHKLGIAKLAQLVDSPRCLKHPENIMRLCCATCNYANICVTCVHGDHVGHDTKDVHTIAEVNTAKLKKGLAMMCGCKDNIYKLRQEVESVATKTDSCLEKQMGMLQDSHRHQGDLLEKIRTSILLNCDNRKNEIEKKYEESIAEIKIDMEKEIKKIREKYTVMFHEKDVKRDDLLEKEEKETKHELSLLEKQKENVNERFKDSEKALQTFKEEADVRSIAASEHSENIIKRYENLTATASSILAADNDWTAVQCIPDICSAVTPLIRDMTNTFTELTKISLSPPSEVLLPVDVTAFEDLYRKSTVGIQCNDLGAEPIVGMVNVPGQGVIINRQGGSKGGYSQCISMHGKVLWSDFPEHYFGFPQSDVQVYKMKAAVRCFPDATTTLDRGSRRKSLWGVHLNDMIDHWPTDLSLQCVASDPLNKRIFAGFRDCRNIYVFNDTLKHVTTFSLPPKVKYPFALAVSVEGFLIVCDASGKRVFSVNLEGDLQSTYLLPLLDGCDTSWITQSVCTDSKDNVFILLSGNELRKVVVQYRKSGGHPLAFRCVSSEISHIAVTQADEGEKLLLAASTSNLLLVYLTTPYLDECERGKEGNRERREPPATSQLMQATELQQITWKIGSMLSKQFEISTGEWMTNSKTMKSTAVQDKDEKDDNIDTVADLQKGGFIDERGRTLFFRKADISLHVPAGALTRGYLIRIIVPMNLSSCFPGPQVSPRVTPLIICEPHGLSFKSPVKLTLPHCAVIKSPDDHKVSVKYGYRDNNTKEMIWKSEAVDWSLSEHYCSVFLYHFSGVDVGIHSAEEKIIRVIPYTKLRRNNKLSLNIWLCNDLESDFHSVMQTEETNAGIPLDSYDTFQLNFVSGLEKSKVTVSLEELQGNSWHFEENEDIIHLERLSDSNKSKSSFLLQGNGGECDEDYMYLLLKITQKVEQEARDTTFVIRKMIRDLKLPVMFKKPCCQYEHVNNHLLPTEKQTRTYTAVVYMDPVKDREDDAILTLWLSPFDSTSEMFQFLQKEQELQFKHRVDTENSFLVFDDKDAVVSKTRFLNGQWSLSPEENKIETERIRFGSRAKFQFIGRKKEQIDTEYIDLEVEVFQEEENKLKFMSDVEMDDLLYETRRKKTQESTASASKELATFSREVNSDTLHRSVTKYTPATNTALRTSKAEGDVLPSQRKRKYRTLEEKQRDCFLFLKRNLADCWKDLGRHLDISEGELSCLNKEYKDDIGESIYKMLICWKQKNGVQATPAKLIEALKKSGRKDLAEKLEEMMAAP